MKTITNSDNYLPLNSIKWNTKIAELQIEKYEQWGGQ